MNEKCAMNPSARVAVPAAEPPAWRRGLLWLLFLGPFFFLSYGFANWMAAQREVGTALYFAWERHIPFLDWSIVPYWSIDLFYGLSFLACRDRREVDRHALRLLTAQLIAVACFLLFPLRFAFERPEAAGLYGWLFDVLAGFDRPYNQAPSLHIALLAIIWARFSRVARGVWRPLLHGWFALVGLSVLTTYQHHFIDLPTGLLLGLLCLWLWPEEGPSPLARTQPPASPRARGLALGYLLGAGLLGLTALALGGAVLWLLWGSVALLMVAGNYAVFGAAGFQKRKGRPSPAVRLLLAPYLLAAWLNSRLWTRRHPQADCIADDVWLGRMPTRGEMARGGFAALCDLSAELSAPQGDWRYAHLPWLDLLPPTPAQLAEAARQIEALGGRGPVLVCCALGYGRSAAAVAAWLLATGRVGDADAAAQRVRERRPGAVFGPAVLAALRAMPAAG